MAALVYFDPLGISRKIIDFLRLKFIIFTKEPILLFYASTYIGSFIAKGLALILIVVLLALHRMNIDENLALRLPVSGKWRAFILPFIILSAYIRIYYAQDPLVPNLPLKLVFPDSMIAGNTIIILSVLFVAPITEELIFRGYMFDVLKRSFGVYFSVLITSMLFALAHFPKPNFEAVDFLIIFIGGIILGMARHKTNSILPPTIFHGIYNLVSVGVGVIYYFLLGY